jgi:hypothetical protein
VVIYFLRNIRLLERFGRELFMALAINAKRFVAIILPEAITAAPRLLNSTNVFAEQKIQSPIEGDADLFVQSGQFA